MIGGRRKIKKKVEAIVSEKKYQDIFLNKQKSIFLNVVRGIHIFDKHK